MITKTVQVNSNYFLLMEAKVSGETWGLLYISTRLTFLSISNLTVNLQGCSYRKRGYWDLPFIAIYVGKFFQGICSVRHPSD